MVKHLKGTDKEREAFLDSLFFSLNYHSLLPLAVTMFQKYREVCHNKLGLLKAGWRRVSEMNIIFHFSFFIFQDLDAEWPTEGR